MRWRGAARVPVRARAQGQLPGDNVSPFRAKRRPRVGILALLILGTAGLSEAQTPSPPLAAPALSAAPAPPSPVGERPRLVLVTPTSESAALGESLRVMIAGLDQWRNAHKDSELVLYLDGHPMTNVSPLIGASAQEVVLQLEWARETAKDWSAVFGRPAFKARPVRVQIGEKGQAPFEGSNIVQISTLPLGPFAAFGVAFAILLTMFVMVARTSDVLRDNSPAPAAGRRPYSLAKTQMAIWFFVVLAAFLFIFIVTRTYEPLTGAVLALIGISTATALSAIVIDSNKQAAIRNAGEELDKERLQLEAEIHALDTRIAGTKTRIAAPAPGDDPARLKDQLTADEADLANKQTRHDQVTQRQIAASSQEIPPRSKRFLDDILSDEYGVSFHRLQMLVWTIVLVLIFTFVVYHSLAMPDFDEKLLALMGISSGTYLGFKFPETK